MQRFKDMTSTEKAEYLNDRFFEIDGKLYHRELGYGRTTGIVGSVNNSGYLVVKVTDKLELVHRIIFAMHHGYWAENNIDHIDGNSQNNHIKNLQEVSTICNITKACRRVGRSGYRGIYQISSNNWRVQMKFNNRSVYSKVRHTRIEALSDWVDMVRVKIGDSACLAPQFIRTFKLIARAHRLFGDNRVGAWDDKRKRIV